MTRNEYREKAIQRHLRQARMLEAQLRAKITTPAPIHHGEERRSWEIELLTARLLAERYLVSILGHKSNFKKAAEPTSTVVGERIKARIVQGPLS